MRKRCLAGPVVGFVALSLAGSALAESAARQAAHDAFKELRRTTMLVTECESAFMRFWKVYIGPGQKGMITSPALTQAGDYFGYGAVSSQPLLHTAEQICARQTGARGDQVVLVLKDRESAKYRRQKKLQHAERIIGY